MDEGIFPDTWKLAMITPIYKSGQKLDLCNYRPISLLSVLSKLFEKIVHDQVSKFMKENGLFSNCQHGFRQLHSTVTSLIGLTDLWFSNIDRKKVNISVFLDLKKAFETVDHDLLMSKLAACGITGGPHQWFSSYLKRREQYCQISGVRSSRRVIQCGIPQGSCLGPLLFIICANDFPHYLRRSSPNMYADDTTVTYSAYDIETLCDDINEELTNISEWMRKNKLSLNGSKSEFLIVGHKRQLNAIEKPVQLVIDEDSVRRVQKVKYLGIEVDENLTWNERYKCLKNKIKCGLSSIRKLATILLHIKLDQVYRALVESHLRYRNELWGSLSDTKLNHLQYLQDRARALIENEHSKDGLVCNWLSVINCIKYDKAVMIYKILNNLCPGSLHGKFTMRSQISAYETRNCHDISIPKRNLEFSKRIFQYSAAKLWNKIPLQIRNSSTIFVLKRKLKEYLLH